MGTLVNIPNEDIYRETQTRLKSPHQGLLLALLRPWQTLSHTLPLDHILWTVLEVKQQPYFKKNITQITLLKLLKLRINKDLMKSCNLFKLNTSEMDGVVFNI